MSTRTWWEGRYETDGKSWWDPRDLDDKGHPVVYGRDQSGRYYKKTHRGKRGRPTNVRLREALEDKELAIEREQDLLSDLKSLKSELRGSKDDAYELEDAISAVHQQLEEERANAIRAQRLAEEEAENRVELELQLKELRQELEAAQSHVRKDVPANLKTELPESASSSSGTVVKTKNKIPTFPRLQQTEAKSEVEEEPIVRRIGRLGTRRDRPGESSEVKEEEPKRRIGVAFDYHNTLDIWRSRDQKFPIPGSITTAVESVIEEGVEVGILSFAVDRAKSVYDTLAHWQLFEFLKDIVVTDQRFGAPYSRDGNLTQGGKDYHLASKGVNVLFDDSANICTACEAQGIVVYRIDPPDDPRTHGTHHSYRTVEDAIAAFLSHLKQNPEPFYRREPFFDADKVPWLSTKRHKEKARCFKCGEVGHKSYNCPKRTR